MSVPFEPGDPVWVSLYGDLRRAVFLRYDGQSRVKVRMRSGTVRSFRPRMVSFRYEKTEE